MNKKEFEKAVEEAEKVLDKYRDVESQEYEMYDRMMNDWEQEQFMKFGQSVKGHPLYVYSPEELQELEDQILDEMD